MGWVRRAGRLMSASARWIAAGRPVRPDEEVRRIFTTICKPCPNYQELRPGRGICRLCGCRLNLNRGLNKLRWATESCPARPPRFTAAVDVPGVTLVTDGEAAAQERSRELRKQRRERRMGRAERIAARRNRAEQEARQLEDLRARIARTEAEHAAAHELAEQEENGNREPADNPRASARARRAARRKSKERWSPPQIVLPPNNDPLLWYDRNQQPIGHTLRDLWRPSAAFLVAGGPSLQTMDLSPLRERGILSLGINNVAGYAPVRAMTFSDPPEKFHHGVFFDGSIMKFVPKAKLTKRVRAKLDDGSFAFTAWRVADCPNVWGYSRNAIWNPETFFNCEHASWGNGKDGVAVNGRPKILFTFFLGFRLLHYLGVRTVYMIGVDFSMSEDDGEGTTGYAFNQGRTAGAARGNNNHYRIAQSMCIELRPYFEAAGFRVFNCNPKSALTAFDYVPFTDAVEACRGVVPREPFDLSGWYEKTVDGRPVGEDDRGE